MEDEAEGRVERGLRGVEGEKTHLGNIGEGIVEGSRAKITVGDFVWVRNEKAGEGRFRTQLMKVTEDRGATCMVERLQGEEED